MVSENQQLDHFYINRLIADGGMGSVFLAHDERLDRDVALKVMHPHLSRDQSFRDRFLQEGRAIARLRHPNIVTIHQLGGDNPEHLYLVMDYFEDGNLRDYMVRTRITLGEALELTRQIAEALHYAHQQDMIHRDIKPENILMQRASTEGRYTSMNAVLADFGLVKLKTDFSSVVSAPIGTMPYMAPETFSREQPIDSRTDIYSLGVVLFELVLGQRPFSPRDLVEAMQMHTDQPVPDMESVRPGVPQPVQSIITRCLEKDPQNRFPTGHDLAQAIGEALTNRHELQLTENKRFDTPVESTRVPDDPKPIVAALENTTDLDVLAIQRGGQLIDQFSIKNNVIHIGRSRDNDIVLDDENVSSHHVTIECIFGRCVVMDEDSTNGTYLGRKKITPRRQIAWESGIPIAIGGYHIWLLPAAEPVEEPPIPAPVEPPPVNDDVRKSPIRAKVSADTVTVKPNECCEIMIDISNRQSIVDHFNVEIDGVDPEWYTLPDAALRLMPKDHSVVKVQFHPPLSSQAQAGEYPLALRVVSRHDATNTVEKPVTLVVTEHYHFSANMPHSILEGWRQDTHLELTNTGNCEDTFEIGATDDANALEFAVENPQVALPPGESTNVSVHVARKAARYRRFVGRPWHYRFHLHISGKEKSEQCLGALSGGPLIPAYFVPFLVIAIAGLIFLAVDRIDIGPDTTTPAPSRTYRALFAYSGDSPDQATQYQSVLEDGGIATTLLRIDDTGTTTPMPELTDYDIILIGPFVDGYYRSSDDSKEKIMGSGKPVIGIGFGGHWFYYYSSHITELWLGSEMCQVQRRTHVSCPDRADRLWQDPNQLLDDPVNSIIVYSEPGDVRYFPIADIEQDQDPDDTDTFRVHDGFDVQVYDHPIEFVCNSRDYAPIVIENEQYMFWGFDSPPSIWTQSGEDLFVKAVYRMIESSGR